MVEEASYFNRNLYQWFTIMIDVVVVDDDDDDDDDDYDYGGDDNDVSCQKHDDWLVLSVNSY